MTSRMLRSTVALLLISFAILCTFALNNFSGRPALAAERTCVVKLNLGVTCEGTDVKDFLDGDDQFSDVGSGKESHDRNGNLTHPVPVPGGKECPVVKMGATDACRFSGKPYMPSPAAAPDGDPVGESFTVTLSDVASFAPVSGVFGMEPHGWAVVDRPANFVGGSASQVKSGTVLDTPVQVRFTAVRYEVDFGDGSQASFTGQGKTWKELGLPMFSHTSTSHVYSQRGTFQARVSAVFRAEFSTGGAWAPIDGELTLAPQNLDVLVVDARSALVSRNCHHGAPGCP